MFLGGKKKSMFKNWILKTIFVSRKKTYLKKMYEKGIFVIPYEIHLSTRQPKSYMQKG